MQPTSTYLRPPVTRRLWMLTPDHLTTNRQRIVYKLITPPTIPATNTVFKNPSLRDLGEFPSFEQKLLILPAVWLNCCSVSKSCPTLLQPHGLQHLRLFCLQDSPSKNTGVGCHFLHQGTLPNPGIKPEPPA